jgi:crotonobetainyl-CoA:carnitine CoA-transferase CaiB-like acyl-CoA transferase
VTDPRFAAPADRLQHRVALEATLAAWTAEREVRQVVLRLQAAGVPAHRVSNSGDILRDPQLKFRRHFATVQHPELGPVLIEGSRMRFSHARAQITRPGPTIGQDNDYVLREILGMGDEEITELIVAGGLT